jgi:hypothetical protein
MQPSPSIGEGMLRQLAAPVTDHDVDPRVAQFALVLPDLLHEPVRFVIVMDAFTVRFAVLC